MVEQLKCVSSTWLKQRGPEFADFHWQRGYGAFSVGPSELDAVIEYITQQESHHQRLDFQEEFRAFLIQHDFTFDERYVWD